ncbi:YaaC family protein [Enterococcus sp. DIV1368c]|uniref:YaaC family protein n=1 Tax=Enterococcus sp. DIV1368c TaxID=2774815 RepID=UPI003F27C227
MDKYYSENPEKDIWIKLKHYSFLENIERYFEKKDVLYDEALAETISGSILQAFEYFEASKTATIQTAPLLLYYGATNLLFGASCLKAGKLIKVKGHGMKLSNQNDLKKNVLENSVKLVDPSTGGFNLYLKNLTGEEINTQEGWTLKELIGSIPEISKEYISIFGMKSSFVVPLYKVITDEEENLRLNFNVVPKEILDEKLKWIVGYDKNYHKYTSNNSDEAIFRTKLNGSDLFKTSFYNEHYFSIGHKKNGEIVNFESSFFEYILLYGLATICRYHPNIWTPFVRNDTSGVINFIEKFLLTSRRYLPNYVLNKIEEKPYFYSNELYNPISTRTNISEKKLEEMIKSKILQMGG